VWLVSAEPVLAGRVMQLASSAALNPRGTPILELRTGVARLGFDSLRAAAISFAMMQLRIAPSFQGVQASLAALWKDNVTLAATACVVARHCRRAGPDTALFAGLIAGVGKITLLAKARRHPAMLNDSAAYHQLVRDWHAMVAQARRFAPRSKRCTRTQSCARVCCRSPTCCWWPSRWPFSTTCRRSYCSTSIKRVRARAWV
jgi:HD-like signal output (HDOD) protein